MTFPREGKFTSSHSFASKDVTGISGWKNLKDKVFQEAAKDHF